MKYLLTLDSKMETKLITKTIKELADEFDGNVEQLHRTISGYEQLTKDQKKEIEYLETENSYARYDAGLERSARARAEKTSDTSIFVMFGDKNAGNVGPIWMFLMPSDNNAKKTIIAFCSYHAIL